MKTPDSARQHAICTSVFPQRRQSVGPMPLSGSRRTRALQIACSVDARQVCASGRIGVPCWAGVPCRVCSPCQIDWPCGCCACVSHRGSSPIGQVNSAMHSLGREGCHPFIVAEETLYAAAYGARARSVVRGDGACTVQEYRASENECTRSCGTRGGVQGTVGLR